MMDRIPKGRMQRRLQDKKESVQHALIIKANCCLNSQNALLKLASSIWGYSVGPFCECKKITTSSCL